MVNNGLDRNGIGFENVFVNPTIYPVKLGNQEPLALAISPTSREGGITFSLQDPNVVHEIGIVTIRIDSPHKATITSVQDYVGKTPLDFQRRNAHISSETPRHAAENRQAKVRKRMRDIGGSPKPLDLPRATNPGVEEFVTTAALQTLVQAGILDQNASLYILPAQETYWGRDGSTGVRAALEKSLAQALLHVDYNEELQLDAIIYGYANYFERSSVQDYRRMAQDLHTAMANLKTSNETPNITIAGRKVPLTLYVAELIAQDVTDTESAQQILTILAANTNSLEHVTSCIESLVQLTTAYRTQFAVHESLYSNVPSTTIDGRRIVNVHDILHMPYSQLIQVG